MILTAKRPDEFVTTHNVRLGNTENISSVCTLIDGEYTCAFGGFNYRRSVLPIEYLWGNPSDDLKIMDHAEAKQR